MPVSSGQINAGVSGASGVASTVETYGKGQSESTGAAMGKGALSGAATGAAIGSIFPVIGNLVGGVVGGVVGGFVGLFSNNSKKNKERAIIEAAEAKAAVEKGIVLQSQFYVQALQLSNIANGGFWQKFHAGVAADNVADANAEVVRQKAPEYGVIISVIVLVGIFGYNLIKRK